MNIKKHIPVLLKETLQHLSVRQSGTYIDGTYGRGGHSQEILKLIGNGSLIVFDKDEEAIKHATAVAETDPRLHVVHSDFSKISEYCSVTKLKGNVSGILLDLGPSSDQLDDPARGFSFQEDGPLDMRMDQRDPLTAEQVVNHSSLDELVKIFKVADERHARKIATAIKKCPFRITKTKELKDIIVSSIGYKEKKHPATRCFLGLRIHVNNEMSSLLALFKHACDLLEKGGRVAVISFHSYEDRQVKHWMKSIVENNFATWVVKKVFPTEEEIKANPRSRSAILRVIEKT